MPHTRKRSNVPPKWTPADFVAISLTPEDREAIKAAPNTFETIDDSLIAMLAEGYKFTLKYDGYNQCFACYVLGVPGSHNAGAILTGRGSTPLRAVKQALYMHRVVLDGEWPDVNEPKREPFDD